MKHQDIIAALDVQSPEEKPVYQRLYDSLTALMEAGDLVPGDALPPEQEIAEGLGVSRGTVRRTMGRLVDEGWVRRQPGLGTFVAERQVGRSLDALLPYSGELAAQGFSVSSSILEFSVIEPDEVVGAALGLEEGERTYYIRRLRLADGVPRAVEKVYVPCRQAPGLLEADLDRSLYEAVARLSGSTPVRAQERYEAVNLAAGDAALLDEPEGAAAFRITRDTVNDRGESFEHSVMLVPGDRSTYHVTLTSEGSAGELR